MSQYRNPENPNQVFGKFDAANRQSLRWTEEDTKAVEQYLKDLNEGKIKVINITSKNASEILGASDSEFYCGKCNCHNQEEGSGKSCECPCHRPGGCNYE